MKTGKWSDSSNMRIPGVKSQGKLMNMLSIMEAEVSVIL